MLLKSKSFDSRNGSPTHFYSYCIEAALGLLAEILCFHVHVQLSPSLICFLFLHDPVVHFEINDGKKLPSSVITFVNEIDSLQLL